MPNSSAAARSELIEPPVSDLRIWQPRERSYSGSKPRFLIQSNSAINLESDFAAKHLCDGPTMTAGHACTFSCSFCYVDAVMRKNSNLNQLLRKMGLRHEDVVVELANPVEAVRHALLGANGKPRFNNPEDQRVIYGSPLVDVAGTEDQAKTTVEMCREILQHTHWHIRLLSKSALLEKVARQLSQFRDRMIYGWSTGTLETEICQGFELGTTPVSRRLAALKTLQNEGFRTYAMLCPVLPQGNYDDFAQAVVQQIDVNRCEHVWAEALNERMGALPSTAAALRRSAAKTSVTEAVRRRMLNQAERIDDVTASKEAWRNYAKNLFDSLATVVPKEKLKFLQYVTHDDVAEWRTRIPSGAILLGAHAPEHSDSTPLTVAEAEELERLEGIVEHHLHEFVAVGRALIAIREKGLYRQTGLGFDGYLRQRFGFGGSYGSRLMRGAQVVDQLPMQLSESIQLSESHTRQLLQVPADQRVAVLEEAKKRAAGGRITARQIEAVAEEIAPKVKARARTESGYNPRACSMDVDWFRGWIAAMSECVQRGAYEDLQKALEDASKDPTQLKPRGMLEIPTQSKSPHPLSPWCPRPITHKGLQFGSPQSLFEWLRFDGHPDLQVKMGELTAHNAVLFAAKHDAALVDCSLERQEELMEMALGICLRQYDDLKEVLRETAPKTLVFRTSDTSKGYHLFWGAAMTVKVAGMGGTRLARSGCDCVLHCRGSPAALL